MFLNDETSDKPKEDRIVKFKDEVAPERGRSKSKKSANSGPKAVGASILKTKKEEVKTELKTVLKNNPKTKPKAPEPPVVVPKVETETTETKTEEPEDIPKEPEKIVTEAIVEVIESDSKEKEESGYDSDQTLATLSAKDSASEASSLNSPASSVKKDLNKTEELNDSDVEQDLSLESIITSNEVKSIKFCSLDPALISNENVTSVEVAWLNNNDNNNTKNSAVDGEDEDELKAICADEERSSVTSSIPMDFGESLPPTLTTLMHKQFLLYRIYKESEAELGVLITKKIQRDRRTSGYVIAYIEPDGLVSKDGRFKVGDELINVNGNSLRGLSMEAARNVLRQLSGHVDIIVARQPQTESNQSSNAGKYIFHKDKK